MATDDEHTPVETPRARRTSSIAISLVDVVAADVVAWAEQQLGVSLPPLPEQLRQRNSQRLAGAVRAAAAVEAAECDRLRIQLAACERECMRLRSLLRTAE